jgi:hypothetical protein
MPGPEERMPLHREDRYLPWLILANVAASILHYVDNILYFASYPEPSWATPHLVDAFWFVMTPFALCGYLLIRRGRIHSGSFLLYAYSAMSLVVLGHYFYAPFERIAFRIHLFILLEVVLALALSVYVLFRQIRTQRPARGTA